MLGLLQQVAQAASAQADTAALIPAHGVASEIVVKNPVPGVVGRLFQLAFNLPSWLQAGGAVVGGIVALILFRMIYVRRHEIGAWLGRQSNGYKVGLASVSALMLIGAGGVGYAGNHYMQHDNDFCVGCHVMGDAWTAFQQSEHRKLQCHSCHRQSMFVSAMQLVNWVAEKPQDIPKHAKVPTAVCSECHVQSKSDSGWKRIVNTAGHRLHLSSDSSALKNIACVTCHGQEVHRFKPVDKTCGQSGCHASKDTKIVLGKMAGQTSQHCTGCHTFTRVVPENISMDSTRKFLRAVGTSKSCFGCHEMTNKLKGFNTADDRGHNGVCGTCHNPHTQTEPKAAYESCANSGCHSDLATKSKFHAGVHQKASKTCGDCHKAHDWKAVGRECVDCHKNIFNGTPGSTKAVKAPNPSNKSADAAAGGVEPSLWRPIALSVDAPARVTRGQVHRTPSRVRQVLRPVVRQARANDARVVTTRVRRQVKPAEASAKPAQPPKDSPTFSHKIHKVLACGGCHDQKASPGSLTVRNKTDCAQCHHAPDRSVACQGCHTTANGMTKAFSKTVSMRIADKAPAPRTLSFSHQNHKELECKGCHTNGVLLGVTKDCASCHDNHHTAERNCATCHRTTKTLHDRSAHDGCAGSTCHSNAAVLALPTSRTTCLACHAEQVNHKPKRECAECHAVSWTAVARTPR